MKTHIKATNFTGEVVAVNFYDADSGYTIISVKTALSNCLAVGYFNGCLPGEVIEAWGYWRENNNEAYFYAEKFDKLPPVTLEGMAAFLNAGAIAGFTPDTVNGLLAHFGEQALATIAYDLNRLADIDGMTSERLGLIKASWQKYADLPELRKFLQSCGVSPALADMAYEKLGEHAKQVIYTNPFQLAVTVPGLNFLACCKIAKKLNISPETPAAVKYGLLHLLNNLHEEGHTYYPYKKILKTAVKKLGLKPDRVKTALAESALTRDIVMDDLNDSREIFVINHKAVYPRKSYYSELKLAEMIKRHRITPCNHRLQDVHWFYKIINDDNMLDPALKNCLKTIFSHKISIVDENLKLNKRRIVSALADLTHKAGLSLLMTAFNNSISKPRRYKNVKVQNLPQLLKYEAASGSFFHNEHNKLNCDILIVSQASLLNILSLNLIMAALPNDAILVLTGDSSHQLPPGSGQVYHDLLDTKEIPVITLSQPETGLSPLSEVARKLSRGIMPKLPEFRPFKRGEPNFYFIEQNNLDKIMKTISGLCVKRLPQAFGFGLMDIQVIGTSRKGPLGTRKMNLYLQECYNGKRTGGFKYNGFIYKINDKIIRLGDDLDKGLPDGAIGYLTAVDFYRKLITVNFEGENITYGCHELHTLMPAYAIPVQKAVSKKFKAVIIPMHAALSCNLNRSALCSALAVTAEIFIMVGQKRALQMALDNNKHKKRYSRFKEMLCRLD